MAAGQTIPGIPDADIAAAFSVPTIVFRSGASDPAHPRATSEAVAALIPGARLLEPPWGDREWIERGEQRDAPGESLFKSWPLLVPQLADFGQQIPVPDPDCYPARASGGPPSGWAPGSALSNNRSHPTFTPANTRPVSSTASTRSGAMGKLSWPTMCG
jgi:hypothetical protein